MILDKYLEATEDRIELRNRFQKMMEDAIFVIPSLQTARYHRGELMYKAIGFPKIEIEQK